MDHKRAPGRRRVAWVSMLAASCLTLTLAIHGAAQDALPGPATPQDAITAILDAFRSFRVVSFPGGHTDANESQALDVMDRYIRGEGRPGINDPAGVARRPFRVCLAHRAEERGGVLIVE